MFIHGDQYEHMDWRPWDFMGSICRQERILDPAQVSR